MSGEQTEPRPAEDGLRTAARHRPLADVTETRGLSIEQADDDDPMLVGADGVPVDTWRQEYPYPERLERTAYEHDKRLLHKKRARLAAMRHVLSLFPDDGKDPEIAAAPDPQVLGSAALLSECGEGAAAADPQRILPRLSGA